MVEFWNRLWESVSGASGGMTVRQRVGLVIFVLAFAVVIGGIINMGAAPDERLLVGAEDRNRHKDIMTLLQSIQVEPILKNGEIWVKADDYEKASVELAAAGIYTDKDIYKFLEEQNLTTTRDQFNMQVQVARQRQLEYLIGKMDAIEWARVVYAQSSQQYISLGDRSGRPTASVSVKPRHGVQITTKVAIAIAELVSGAVAGMEREDVKVIDSTTSQIIPVPGKDEQMYAGFHLHELEKQKAAEIRDSIQRLLREFIPRMGVEAEVKFNGEVRKQFEQIGDENKSAAIKTREHKLDEERYPVGYSPALDDVKGALTLPEGVTGPIVKKNERETDLDPLMSFLTREREWKVGTDLENISVSVLVPEEIFKDKEGKALPPEKVVPHMETIQKAVAYAAGYGDPKKIQVNVGVMPSFLEPIDAPVDPWYAMLLEHLGDRWVTYTLLILSVASLVVIVRLIRLALEKKRTEELEAAVGRAAEETPELSDWQEAEAVAERLRGRIREMVQKNPRAVAGVLKRWMGHS